MLLKLKFINNTVNFYLIVDVSETFLVQDLIEELITIANTGKDPHKLLGTDPSNVHYTLWQMKLYFQGAKREHLFPTEGSGTTSPHFWGYTIREWVAAQKSPKFLNAFLFRRAPSSFFMGIAFKKRTKEEFINSFLENMQPFTLRAIVPFQTISHFDDTELQHIIEQLVYHIPSISPNFKELTIWDAQLYLSQFILNGIRIVPEMQEHINDQRMHQFKRELEGLLLQKHWEPHAILTRNVCLPDKVADIVTGYLGVDVPLSTSNPTKQSPYMELSSKLAHNEEKAKRLLKLVDTIRNNIYEGKEGRRTCGKSGEKVRLLDLGITRIAALRAEEKEINTAQELRWIESVCFIKRHRAAWWEPHSANEYQKLKKESFPEVSKNDSKNHVLFTSKELKKLKTIKDIDTLFPDKRPIF